MDLFAELFPDDPDWDDVIENIVDGCKYRECSIIVVHAMA